MRGGGDGRGMWGGGDWRGGLGGMRGGGMGGQQDGHSVQRGDLGAMFAAMNMNNNTQNRGEVKGHDRRGHERVIHRGQPNEFKVWVKGGPVNGGA